ncbi:MAG: amidohydrolase family protein [Cyclobacteriaceae bacterium]
MRPVVFLAFAMVWFSCQKQEYDIVIRNAIIIDGSGDHSFEGAVAINGDTIARVGDLEGAIGKQEIDAHGWVLAPGFVDTHSHHDRGMFEEREVLAAISQGITTIVVGQDGFSNFPVADFFSQLEQTPVSVNVASYTGHNTLRRAAMTGAYDRPCTPDEIAQMTELIKQDMAAGAIGLSTGLEYDPGIYSTAFEVMALAKVVAGHGGRYISHIRSEDIKVWEAIREVIQIGKETGMPVQISHAKLAMKKWWEQADRMVALLDSASKAGVKISIDVYPYTYWQSTMKVLFPDRDVSNLKKAEFALRELTSPESLILNNFTPNPEYVGRTLAEIALLRKSSAPQTLIDLIKQADAEGGDESIIATSMYEMDVATLLRWREANVCSDGSSHSLHPRGFGAFPKFFRKYVVDDRSLTIEDAIYKMSGLSARHMGFKKRGQIRAGNYADLVLFDPVQFKDQATTEQPRLQATGLRKVWVNGKVVYENGEPTGVFPGHVLRRTDS